MKTLLSFLKRSSFLVFLVAGGIALSIYLQKTFEAGAIPAYRRLLIQNIAALILVNAFEQLSPHVHRLRKKGSAAKDLPITLLNVTLVGWIISSLFAFILQAALRGVGSPVPILSPNTFGPFWLQLLVAIVLVNFFQYWVHRFQHQNRYLWKLHSLHHSVSEVYSLNASMAHPLDFAFRNTIPAVVLSFIGFNPLALVACGTIRVAMGVVSHSGANYPSHWLSYFIVTSEVHRWHHSIEPREANCNFSLSIPLWDQVFGTFHLSKERDCPEKMGIPDGFDHTKKSLKDLLLVRY